MMNEEGVFKTEIPEAELKVEVSSDYELPIEEHFEIIEESLKIEMEESQSRVRKKVKDIFCEICPDEKAFSSKYTLQRHMNASHRVSQSKKERFPKVNLCSICAKLISNGKRGLEYHVSHHGIQIPSIPFNFSPSFRR
jgi:hypothetical protein